MPLEWTITNGEDIIGRMGSCLSVYALEPVLMSPPAGVD